MTLPFSNNKKPRQRKYQCFVCGEEFTDYDLFKSHIVESHVEGREYLLCSHCGAPVRDIRLHYKVKHRGHDVPKSGQMKAVVWYDFSGNKRKRDKKKPPFKEGYFASTKNNKEVHYRSGYELSVYEILEKMKDVINYDVEPIDCVTTYFWDGAWKKYWPDLKVNFTDGHTEVWEIKPFDQKDNLQNQAKWDACAKYMGNRNIRFSVKTESFIERSKQKFLNESINKNGYSEME